MCGQDGSAAKACKGKEGKSRTPEEEPGLSPAKEMCDVL